MFGHRSVMNRFGQYPFVRILLPFLIGIILDIHFDLPDQPVIFLLFTLLSIYALDQISFDYLGKYRFRYIHGALINIIFFLGGIFWTSFQDESKSKDHFLKLAPNESLFVAGIINEPVEKEKSIKVDIRIESFLNEGQPANCSGKALLYLDKSSNAGKLKYGDRMLVKVKLGKIQSPQNPGEFDFKTYCRYKNIYGSGYVADKNWKVIGKGGSAVFRFAINTRKRLLDVLHNSGMEEREIAVASAVLIGYSDEIDPDTYKAFSASGTLHVLAVSGLHVAILFLLFDKLFSVFLFFKRGKMYKAFAVVIVLWLYALLTGMSPSVMRAAMMLSFVVIGKLLNRNASVYNVISASAFLLLCINPYQVMQVGFQLSYLAVIGIIFLQPKIYQWFYFKNRILDFTWNLTSVSIAAQLVTFPVSLLYFHQFPNFFLLSNLAVLPLGTLILYIGIFALLFSFIPLINEIFFFILKWLVWILNETVLYIESLPYSVSENISINGFQVFGIYVMLILTVLYFMKGKAIMLISTLSCGILLMTTFIVRKAERKYQSQMVVYSLSRNTGVDFISGNQNHLLLDSLLIHNQKEISFHIEPGWISNGVCDHQIILPGKSGHSVFSYKNYFAFRNVRLVRIDQQTEKFETHKKLNIDFVLVTRNAKLSYDEISSMFNFKKIIIDNSNSAYTIKKWKATGKKNVFIVKENGAFVLDA